MRLQHLEISGFKSFSDRSHLTFDRGVTAIVGPNGCGKSNVADAITWVLGEQSAKSLRGDRMEDVIFNGSDARKPTGAAEVRLRLSDVLSIPSGNGSMTEAVLGDRLRRSATTSRRSRGTVEVTRRLYRSGESEYLIDGEICRLRDVHEFLMDTGLGAKAYAIIEQGKIGMILSSRPTDRRQLIEEAAGITKYKARRRAAELKLEAAQLNLTRLDDIIFELEKQFGSLKRQSAKARRYQRLREELRHWEKVLFAGRYREAGAEDRRPFGRDWPTRTSGSRRPPPRVGTADADFSRVRLSLVEADERATAAREAVHACELDINRARAADRIQPAADRGASSVRGRGCPNASWRRSKRGASRAGLAVVERQRGSVEGASRISRPRPRSWNRHRAGLRRREPPHRGARRRRRGGALGGVFSAERRDHAAPCDPARRGSRRARGRRSWGSWRPKTPKSGWSTSGSRPIARRRPTACGARSRRAEGSMHARTARETELATARIELEWKSNSLQARERELAGLSARLTSLSELEKARAGYTEAARMVLAQANGHVGQQGSVADYLEVEPKYERAVEACLGRSAPARHRRDAQAGGGRPRADPPGKCGPLRLRRPRRRRDARAANACRPAPAPQGLVSVRDAINVTGPHAAAIEPRSLRRGSPTTCTRRWPPPVPRRRPSRRSAGKSSAGGRSSPAEAKTKARHSRHQA